MLFDFLAESEDLLLEVDDHTVLLGLHMADLGDVLLRDLGRSFAHLRTILVHLLELALKQLNLPGQIGNLRLVSADLLSLRGRQGGHLLVLVRQLGAQVHQLVLQGLDERDRFFFRLLF